MARVRIAKPEKIDEPAIQGIFDWVIEMEGQVPNHFYVELNFPEFFTAKLGATKVLWEAGELTMEEIQHIGILVSQANGCSYCTAAFCTILNHGMGTSEGYIESLLASGALTRHAHAAQQITQHPASSQALRAAAWLLVLLV